MRTTLRNLWVSATGLAVLTTASVASAQAEELGAAQDQVTEWVKFATPYILPAIGALLLLFVARIVASGVAGLVRRTMERQNVDPTLTKFISKAVRIAILAASIVAILGVFGVETTSFAAILGAAGLAIGLAFQGTLGNLAAGAMLLVFRPFKVGDFIEVAGQAGTVDEIEIFTTTLVALDNRKIIIPNGNVFGGTIVNVTGNPQRRVDVNVGTEYSADLDETRKVLEAACAQVKGGLQDPPPQVYLKELGDSSINWSLRVWCECADYWGVREDLTYKAKVALDNAKIGIPFPQMDVHLDKLN